MYLTQLKSELPSFLLGDPYLPYLTNMTPVWLSIGSLTAAGLLILQPNLGRLRLLGAAAVSIPFFAVQLILSLPADSGWVVLHAAFAKQAALALDPHTSRDYTRSRRDILKLKNLLYAELETTLTLETKLKSAGATAEQASRLATNLRKQQHD